MLGVNVTYDMKPGMRESFLEEIAACGVQETIRREAGCIRYDYFRSVDDPDRLLLVERWTGPEAQRAHAGQPHISLVAAAKERCVAGTTLEFYTLED